MISVRLRPAVGASTFGAFFDSEKKSGLWPPMPPTTPYQLMVVWPHVSVRELGSIPEEPETTSKKAAGGKKTIPPGCSEKITIRGSIGP